MKRTLIYSAIAIIAGALLIRLLQHDTGYILIQAYGKTIEMRFGALIISVLVIGLVIWLLVRLLAGLINLFTGGFGYARRRRSERSRDRTQRGLTRYMEGDWRAAQRDLVKGAKHSPDPAVQYLAAAHSAAEMGDSEAARALIHKAAESSGGSELAVLLSQARLELRDGKYEQALATLQRCQQRKPHHPVVLELLADVYLKLRDYAALEALLPALDRAKVLPEPRLQHLAEEAYLGQLRDLEKRLSEHPPAREASVGDHHALAPELSELWGRVPRALRSQPALLAGYATLLVRTGQHDAAEAELRQVLPKSWDRRLVDLYGICESGDVKRQLQQVHDWLKTRPEDARLHLAAGRLALRNELWGPAREHFVESIKLEPAPDACAELGRLLSYLGEADESLAAYQRGLMMSTHGLPHLPMPRGLTHSPRPDSSSNPSAPPPPGLTASPYRTPSAGGQQKPLAEHEKPLAETEEPSAETEEPSAQNEEPSAQNEDPSAEHMEPSADDEKRSTKSDQEASAGGNGGPSTSDTEVQPAPSAAIDLSKPEPKAGSH